MIKRSIIFIVATLILTTLALTGNSLVPSWQAEASELLEQACAPLNLALGRPVDASSYRSGNAPANAVDGDLGTRWGSAWSDNQWIYVDLGTANTINTIVLRWESAYGKEYKIQVSNNATSWTDIYHETNGNGGVDIISGLSTSGRYVRMLGIDRGTSWGYSLWEFEVYGGNLALGRSVAASSYEGSNIHTKAVDGNLGTRWGSNWNDNQWIYVDLGTVKTINTVVLRWEAAYGKEYKIQVSDNATSWTDVHHETNGSGGVDIISGLSASGRYVRMRGIDRGTGWGYSLWEFEVYGGNLALGRSVAASSYIGSNIHTKAVDGNLGTRWGSEWNDNQWIYVDLGTVKTINTVVLRWEAAYGEEYKIQVSNNATSWTDVHHETNGSGGVDVIGGLSTSGRYVRMLGIYRGTSWGYSLWEFEVYRN